jgi:biotin synthase
MSRIKEYIARASDTGELGRDEIIALLELPEGAAADLLFAAADRVRKEYVGDEVYLRGIVEFSNYCERNCVYCGLRRGNDRLARYRIPDDGIIEAAHRIKAAGIGTIVLQSGEDSWYTRERLCALVSRVKSEAGLVITLSIGERPYEDYAAFKHAGADRFLLKHETASPDLYKRLHPDSLFDKRLQCLSWLGELGFEVGAGCMVGLPGQDLGLLADDILLVKRIDADMVGIGPFLAHPDTPLKEMPDGDAALTVKALAVARLLTRTANIPATTALGILDPRGRELGLAAGANVMMPDFTPERYRLLYDLYPGRSAVTEPEKAIEYIRKYLATVGRSIGSGPGDRPKSHSRLK